MRCCSSRVGTCSWRRQGSIRSRRALRYRQPPACRPNRTYYQEEKAVNTPCQAEVGGNALGAKVLVTGGTGITGGYLSRYLAEHGYTVRALDCKSSWIVDDLRKLGVEVVLGDVTDPDSVREAVKGVEVVYHLAAIYNQENVTNRQFWEANALGVKNM